jgi:hypothetical protein
MDNDATDHTTSELQKLDTWDNYAGRDQVHNASGEGMDISHVGHSVLHTLIVPFISTIFCIFQVPIKIYYPLIKFPFIMMILLSSILSCF